MKHEERIREQARIARGLAAERKSLFEQVPFAKELERDSQDLERMARPVVAVAGTAAVGKSALIQALGSDLPWKWLEVEVPAIQDSSEEPGDAEAGGFGVGELAEHCLLVLPVDEPPSPEVLGWLQQLAEVFPEGSLQVVLTRLDELPEDLPLDAVLEQLREMLQEAVPHRTLPVFAVSNAGSESLEDLLLALAEQLALRQKALLEEALKDWSTLLEDLHALLGLRDLAKLRPETLSRLHLCLDELLAEEIRRLGEELPRLVEESLRELEPRLPEAQRPLTQAFREKMSTRIEPRLKELRQRLDQVLARELARDVDGPVTLTLADRFGRLIEPSALFFDWSFARKGGLLGVGAALLMGVARKHRGWAMLGAALVGGMLAGLFGKGTRVRTAEELKQLVAEPLLEDSRQRLEQATQTSRADVERVCNLLRKVADIFSPSQAATWDTERLGQAVTRAESQQRKLGRELTELHWKHTLEELQSAAKASA
ncbi:hypothetical protein [Vitiosangium sp. GDMCC 1.1324]|uniref:hypothetical protein n=1 Tax=Vitiosangium sp. (strain GDMCC 1.1324) TaxID=2138576 RepID=UPI000D3791AA|nr:hypothetical protein [Vitiosangium sp. GDMCC 1.1324]PTL77040.1 hypothetical protein DAT35_46185 [Vitiosangium sp. GDMCC 1.1324]